MMNRIATQVVTGVCLACALTLSACGESDAMLLQEQDRIDGKADWGGSNKRTSCLAYGAANGGSLYGYSVAAPGDITGDGVADLLVGMPTLFKNGKYPGRAFIFAGPLDGQTLTPEHAYATIEAQVGFGSDLFTGLQVLGVGDLTGDGYVEFAVSSGTHLAVFEGPVRQDARLSISASRNGVRRDGDEYLSLRMASQSRLGNDKVPRTQVQTGDLDANGQTDIVIGDPNAGTVYAYLNPASPDATTVQLFSNLFSPKNESAYSGHHRDMDNAFGWSISVGDLNADGIDDLAVGSPGTNLWDDRDQGQVDIGAAFVYYGPVYEKVEPSVTFLGTGSYLSYKCDFESEFERKGTSVLIANVDGNGGNELVVGALSEPAYAYVTRSPFETCSDANCEANPEPKPAHQLTPGECRGPSESAYSILRNWGDVNGDGVDEIFVTGGKVLNAGEVSDSARDTRTGEPRTRYSEISIRDELPEIVFPWDAFVAEGLLQSGEKAIVSIKQGSVLPAEQSEICVQSL